MTDNLSQLLATPLQPLREQWYSAAQAELLRTARERHDRSLDAYWTWVAEQQRWMRPWDTVRTGELGDFTFFGGGRMNVADNCVDRWAEDPATASRPAVIWEGEPGDVRTVTYAELADEVSRLAGALASLGVAKGDVVAIYMPNAVEAFTAVHACNRIGAIYTILFSGFGPDAVRSRLEASRAKVVIVLDASYRRGQLVPLLDTLRAARGTALAVEHTIVVDRTGRGRQLQDGEISYADALGLAPEGIPAVPLEANDPAFLIFTSGTEARPKGVVHSVAGFLLGTWANVRWQVGPEDADVYWVAADVGWLTFPIQAIVGGLANGITVACFEGALDTPSNARFYEICEKHHVTKVLGAPTLLRMLRKYGDELAAEHPLPDLKLVTVQGEPLDGETFRLGDPAPRRGCPGGQRVRADRDRLDVGLFGRGSRGAQARIDRNGRTRAHVRHPRRRRQACSGRYQGKSGPDPAVPDAGPDGVGRPAPVPAGLLLAVPRLLLHQRRGGARPGRPPVGPRPRGRRNQRGGAPHLHPGDRGHRDRASAGRRGGRGGRGRPDQGHRAGRLPHPAGRRRSGPGPPGGIRRSVFAAGRLRQAGRGLPHLRAAEDPDRQDHAAAAAGCRRARRPAGRHQRHGGSGRTAGRPAGGQQAVAAEAAPRA